MFLATVTHDVASNTLEAVWLEEVVGEDMEVISYTRAKCRNYSSEQKVEFEADCGPESSKYTLMAGWE
jgi:hypothetical protein